MLEDNKTIIAVCALCLMMTLLFACSRGCSKKEPKKVVVTPPKNKEVVEFIEEEKEYKEPVTSSRSSRGNSGSSGNPPALLSEEEKAKMAKRDEENLEKLNRLKKEWMEEKLKDPNLSPVAREQYLLRSNPNFVVGMKALENNDFKTAIKNFNEIAQDEKTTPISKYFACKSLMEVAVKMKDFELYFIAARMKAKLEATEDLSMLGVEKNTYSLDWCDKVENTLKARDDPKYFEICVKLKLKKYDEVTAKMEEKARKDVEKDIKFYTRQFKELIE
ncbi:MAG: hypothetical protein J6Z11_14615 [Candidatus Riflebacteria bacterium]|nr:hypothetical protein [Candidatus Riflebacteria bacterium]